MTPRDGPFPLTVTEVQFKPLAQDSALQHDHRGDSNDNVVVEQWVLNDHRDICRGNHLFENEAWTKTLSCTKPQCETVNKKHTTSGFQTAVFTRTPIKINSFLKVTTRLHKHM